MRRSLLIVVGLTLISVIPAHSWAAGVTDSSFTVASDGSPRNVELTPGAYIVRATGTFRYDYGGSVADAAYSFPGSGIGAACTDRPGHLHELAIDGLFPWHDDALQVSSAALTLRPTVVDSPCNSATHDYAVVLVVTQPLTVEFRIYDDVYWDNAGSLAVSIVGAYS